MVYWCLFRSRKFPLVLRQVTTRSQRLAKSYQRSRLLAGSGGGGGGGGGGAAALSSSERGGASGASSRVSVDDLIQSSLEAPSPVRGQEACLLAGVLTLFCQ